jgi:hypothetical protein
MLGLVATNGHQGDQMEDVDVERKVKTSLGAGILQQLLVPASVMAEITTQQELTTVPILKSPPRDAWCAVHPDHVVGPIAMIEAEVGDGRTGMYGVDRRLLADKRVAREVKPYRLQLAQTSNAHLFLWALREGDDSWAASAHAAAELAAKGWVRVIAARGSGRSGGRYDVLSPEQHLNVDLAWPEMPFSDIVDLALKDRIIDSLEHAVLLRLRGAF